VHALRQQVVVGPRGVSETVRECCRGALREAFRGERFSSGELRHNVGVWETEFPQVLLGWLGS
jgi:hypothetical protein